MNKKLMAVAVAGALAAPAVALAQASNVQLYGRANLGWDNYSATGATAGDAGNWKSRNRIYDAGSRFGLRGEEALGGGLKAIFLMENGVAMDSGNNNGQNGAANSSVGLAARIGYVGLAGNWGMVTLGKQNVWWGNGQHEQWQANYGSVGNQFFTGGGGRGMGVNVNRTANTMMYTSPVWSGINFVASYSPTAGELAPVGQNSKTDGRILALTVQGTHGPWIWAWDYVDNRADTQANGGQGRNQGNKARGGWLYAPGANISLFYVQNKVGRDGNGIISSSGAGGTPAGGLIENGVDLKQSGWGVVWEHTFGNFAVEANWSKQGNIKGCSTVSCDNTDNQTWFLGGRYNLSKRTSLLAFYLKYKNGANYNADPAAGGMTSVSGVLANGADPQIYGVGINHNF